MAIFELGRHLEFPFTKFSILPQHESISFIFSPLSVIFDLIFIALCGFCQEAKKEKNAVAWIEIALRLIWRILI